MFAVRMVYQQYGDHAIATAALKGVVAAAVALILATAVQLGKRSLERTSDLVFVALTILGVNRLHQSVLTVLVVVGLIAVIWYRPGHQQKASVAP
jgi:chromate transporter